MGSVFGAAPSKIRGNDIGGRQVHCLTMDLDIECFLRHCVFGYLLIEGLSVLNANYSMMLRARTVRRLDSVCRFGTEFVGPL